MKSLILLFLVCFATADYFKDRTEFLKSEESQYFGHKIKLAPKEETVNKLLMSEKRKELDDGFRHPENFPPAMNFFLAKEKINKSNVYKFIQKMPKGGALHIHDSGLVNVDYIIKNITYREHLLVCKNDEGMKLTFADPPPQDDCWVPLQKLRKEAANVEDFDNWLRSFFTLETDKPHEKYPDITAAWKAFQNIFDLQFYMITYREVFEDYYYTALQQFYDDNVNYMELRGTFPALYDLNGVSLNKTEVLGLIQSISDRFLQDHPDFLGIKYIHAPRRNVDDETMYGYLELFKMLKSLHPDFLVGFDLIGQEDLGRPLVEFIKNIEENAQDVKFFFHAGETNWNGMSTDLNLVDAILLNTTRIGHAFALLKHPRVMEEIKKRGVAIEICPISHQVLGLLKDLRNHPASHLLTQDFPLVISSDDPGMWGSAPISHDFYEAFMGIASSQADLRTLKQFALNSLVYSALNPQEKGEAISKFLDKWDRFIDDVYKNRFW